MRKEKNPSLSSSYRALSHPLVGHQLHTFRLGLVQIGLRNGSRREDMEGAFIGIGMLTFALQPPKSQRCSYSKLHNRIAGTPTRTTNLHQLMYLAERADYLPPVLSPPSLVGRFQLRVLKSCRPDRLQSA